jgi:hypothetical protein
VELVNPLGKKVLFLKSEGAELKADVSELPDGIYALRIRGKKGSFTCKVLIRKD